MGKKKRTAMRGMRGVSDYNINSNGDKAVRGEVPVPLDRVCRGQAAARKLKRDATRKEGTEGDRGPEVGRGKCHAKGEEGGQAARQKGDSRRYDFRAQRHTRQQQRGRGRQ